MSLTEWLLNFGVSLIDKAGYAGCLLALILDSCGVPIPSEAVLALAGSAARTGRFNLIAVIVIGTVGQTLGVVFAYLIGRYGGEPFIRRYGRYVLISQHDFERAQSWFERRGEGAIFISRLVPVIRTYISFPAGMFEMDITKFVLSVTAGSLLWSVLFAGFGYAVGEQWRHYTHYLHYVDYLIIILIIALAARYVLRKVRAHG